jgi:hypothetical protein
MKTRFRPILYIILSLLISSALYAQEERKEQFTVPLSSPGKPGSLEVELVAGSIKVTGYDGKEVLIEATSPAPKEDENRPANANGMKRITGNSFSIEVEENNNKVEVETDSYKHRINLTIKVPKNFSLKLSTVNNGLISVENVSGETEISNVNGGISLTNISGSAIANTVNGHITALFNEVKPDTPMAFTTLNGNVDVTFASNVKANIKIKSERGEIFTDFDMAIDSSKPKVEQKSSSGVYRVSIEDWVRGKINGGGPEFMFKNMNGNIYIRKSK